ncbi:hypothetical protein [Amycolatopsis arida]|nr:hypothetical protein [Amycolatopsis arida]
MDPTRDLKPDADVQEQQQPVVDDGTDPDEIRVPLEANPSDLAESTPSQGEPPFEANPGDVADQATVVEYEVDDPREV